VPGINIVQKFKSSRVQGFKRHLRLKGTEQPAPPEAVGVGVQMPAAFKIQLRIFQEKREIMFK